MADVPAWPSYPVGPEDSIFALGVVSVNFARFEYAFTWLLTVVSGLHEDFARITLARVGLLTSTQLLDSMIEKKDWPDGAIELIRYFLKATKILAENRNGGRIRAESATPHAARGSGIADKALNS